MIAENTVELWAGEFGNEYIVRNSNLPDRGVFWSRIMKRYKPESVLEVGCNIGHNLKFIRRALPRAEIHGCDVNEEALAILRAQQPGFFTACADVKDLPYDRKSFDMVVCVGVLIHVTNDKDLIKAISEIFRVAKYYVLVAEYWSYDWEMIPYHGYENALRKGPFDKLLRNMGKIVDSRHLDAKDGFDRVHYWLLSL